MSPVQLSLGGRSLMQLVMTLTVLGARVAWAEVTLVHEGALGAAAWGYTLLPSTFPLTWDEARAACEVVPGSMLARVEEWQAEAAVDEYLKTLQFTEPVWLANRQTLPEVLEEEQREMNHIGSVGGGRAGVMSGDLSMGGDVGVTLRCAVYRVGVGVVHELCSANTVSAALCVQRLSSKRPLSAECPPSAYHQWLLVTRQTETIKSEGPDETRIKIVGLQQCHHQHHLGRTACHPQRGWLHTTCPPEPDTSPPKHNRNSKKSHKSHHQQNHGRIRPSYKISHSFGGITDSVGRETHQGTSKDVYHVESLLQDSKRMKRMAKTNEGEINSEENLELHKQRMTSSQRSEMIVAPPAKAKNLNLDLIESIMQDFSDFKGANINKNKGRKNTTGNPNTTGSQARAPKIDDAAFGEEAQVNGLPVTENPAIHKTDTPTVLGEHKHENLVATDAKEDSFIKVYNTSEGNVSTKTDGHLKQTSGPQTRERTAEQTPNANDSQNSQNQDTKETVKTLKGGEEGTGPNILVGVGPIFVQEPDDAIIEAVEAVEPVNEATPEEEVIIITKQDNSSDDIGKDTTKGSNISAGQNPIIFPVLPEFTKPDPTPRLNIEESPESVSSNVINTGPSDKENTDKAVKDKLPPKGETHPGSSSDVLPIIFPRDESQPKQTEAETNIEEATTNAAIVQAPQDDKGATNQAESSSVTAGEEESGMGQLNEGPDTATETISAATMQETAGEPPLSDKSPQPETSASNEKPEMGKIEGKPGMGDESGMGVEKVNPESSAVEEKPETSDTEKSEMGDMEEKSEMGDVEEKSEMGDMEEKSEMSDMEEKSEMGDMEEKSEMGDTEEKPEMGDMEEKPNMGDMEEKSEMGNLEEKSEMGDMEEKSEMGDMKEKSEMGDMEEESEMGDMEEESEMGDMEEESEMGDMEEESEMGDMEERSEMGDGLEVPDVDDVPDKSKMDETAEVPSTGNKPEIGGNSDIDETGDGGGRNMDKQTSDSSSFTQEQNPNTFESQEDSEEESKQKRRGANRSRGQGTQGLLSQILKGIFG